MIKIAHTAGGADITGLHTEEDVLQRANSAIDQMCRDGAASSIRCVTVWQWGDWDSDKLAYRCPPLLEFSLDDVQST
jgi:hypothetical protein